MFITIRSPCVCLKRKVGMFPSCTYFGSVVCRNKSSPGLGEGSGLLPSPRSVYPVDQSRERTKGQWPVRGSLSSTVMLVATGLWFLTHLYDVFSLLFLSTETWRPELVTFTALGRSGRCSHLCYLFCIWGEKLALVTFSLLDRPGLKIRSTSSYIIF